jgi:hypothetical protein
MKVKYTIVMYKGRIAVKNAHHSYKCILSRYTQKAWYVKCHKTITALHFGQYDVLWSTEKQY